MTPDVRHKHLVVRAEIANPPTACSPSKTRGFLNKLSCFAHGIYIRGETEGWLKGLIERINMKTMFGPKAEYCHVEGNRGMTAFAIIETSHIVLHTWDECQPAILQLDVYTCSDLEVQDVLDELGWFQPTKVEYKFIDREHDLTLLSEKVG